MNRYQYGISIVPPTREAAVYLRHAVVALSEAMQSQGCQVRIRFVDVNEYDGKNEAQAIYFSESIKTEGHTELDSERLKKLAKKYPAPQEWYDEDSE